MSNSLWPHGLQHPRLPCPSLTPGAYSNSCPLSQWSHPTISSSVIPFSSRRQSIPESGFFPMSQFFTSGGQSIGAPASVSVLPMNIQDWFPLELTGWISLQSKGLSRVFSSITVQKYQLFCAQLSLWSNCHIHTWPLNLGTVFLMRILLSSILWLAAGIPTIESLIVSSFYPTSSWCIFQWTHDNFSLQEK